VENGTTQSYNGRPTESGIMINELEWPIPQSQGHAILWRWISQKRYDIVTPPTAKSWLSVV